MKEQRILWNILDFHSFFSFVCRQKMTRFLLLSLFLSLLPLSSPLFSPFDSSSTSLAFIHKILHNDTLTDMNDEALFEYLHRVTTVSAPSRPFSTCRVPPLTPPSPKSPEEKEDIANMRRFMAEQLQKLLEEEEEEERERESDNKKNPFHWTLPHPYLNTWTTGFRAIPSGAKGVYQVTLSFFFSQKNQFFLCFFSSF